MWRRSGVIFQIAYRVLVVALIVTGCGSSQSEFTLTSPSFLHGDMIPQTFTCDGKDISPELIWHNPPKNTMSFALICDDPDAPNGDWVHWVIFDILTTDTSISEAVETVTELPNGIKQGGNSWKNIGYGGPCPPQGKPHRYFFRLYALDSKIDLPAGVSKLTLMNSISEHIIAKAELMGLYQRKE